MTPAEEADQLACEILQDRDFIPSPFGSASAAEGSGSVATPLLATAALATAAIVLTSAEKFRWPDLVLLLLTTSFVSFVFCVQAAQWARAFRVDPFEAARWWPNPTDTDKATIKREVADHRESHRLWRHRQDRSYRVGVVLLLFGLAFALVPACPARQVGNLRWAAVAVALLGALAEVGWIVARHLDALPEGNRLRGIWSRLKRFARKLMGRK